MIFSWKRFYVILFEEISTKLYIASLLNLKLKKKILLSAQTFFQPVTLIPTPPLIKRTPPPFGYAANLRERKRGRERVKLSCRHI
jgi:hypothetical protein